MGSLIQSGWAHIRLWLLWAEVCFVYKIPNCVKIQYQVGANDCGLFAIATVYAVCAGQDPGSLWFRQDAMRHHLLNAFETLSLTPFPSTNNLRKKAPQKSSQKKIIEVFCQCRLPDDSTRMVKCCGCGEWYHNTCVRLPADVNSHGIVSAAANSNDFKLFVIRQ